MNDTGDVGTLGDVASDVEDQRPRRRRALLILLAMIGVPILFVAGIGIWFQRQIDPAGEPGSEVEFRIEPGWGVGTIGGELEAADVIGSKLAFEVYARLGGHDDFQAGDYVLRHDLGVRDAIETIEAGPVVVERELRVIPGLWLDEVAAAVADQLDLDAATFIDVVRSGEVRSRYQPEDIVSTEGLLFPDTYRFADDATEVDVVRTMVERFDAVADEIGLAEAPTRAGHSPYEVAIAASLIQGEAKLDVERPLIASVVYNRLGDGIPLQIDASVLYAIGERKPTNTAEDRATDSPYNTYLVTGLPPTPFATTARTSLEAALDPDVTEYRFYVLIDPSGAHAFAVTYEEHLANVERARELGLFG